MEMDLARGEFRPVSLESSAEHGRLHASAEHEWLNSRGCLEESLLHYFHPYSSSDKVYPQSKSLHQCSKTSHTSNESDSMRGILEASPLSRQCAQVCTTANRVPQLLKIPDDRSQTLDRRHPLLAPPCVERASAHTLEE